MAKCESWLSSNRTTNLSLEGLACATKRFTYLTKYSSVIYPERWTVCSMTVLVRWFYLTLPYPFAVSCPNTKRNRKSFAALLVDRPRFRRALTACSNNPDVCCCYMTSSCKYALFSFLNRTEKLTLLNN
jgi:hypothetical protein